MKNESGRSMVEMLGVLAIIGVLSIGGIAGYTLAMRRYKANEIVNAVSLASIYASSANGGTGLDGKKEITTNNLGMGSFPTALQYIAGDQCGLIQVEITDGKVGQLVGEILNNKLPNTSASGLGEQCRAAGKSAGIQIPSDAANVNTCSGGSATETGTTTTNGSEKVCTIYLDLAEYLKTDSYSTASSASASSSSGEE